MAVLLISNLPNITLSLLGSYQYYWLITFIMASRILQWNANGLVAHGDELKQFVFNLDVKPDFICVQETRLRPGVSFSFPGYVIERLDRQELGGGVATFIKVGISYTILAPPPDFECLSIQFCCTGDKKRFTLHNVYNPPDVRHPDNVYQFLFKFKNCIIVGDFNAHSFIFGAKVTDLRG